MFKSIIVVRKCSVRSSYLLYKVKTKTQLRPHLKCKMSMQSFSLIKRRACPWQLFSGPSFVHEICTVSICFSLQSSSDKKHTHTDCLCLFLPPGSRAKSWLHQWSVIGRAGSPVRSFSAVEFISTCNQGQHLGETSASADRWPRLPLLLACVQTHALTHNNAVLMSCVKLV